MVRSYLVESRICYKSDGGSGADSASESAAPRLSPSSQVEEGRGRTTSSPPPTTSFQARQQAAQNTIDEALNDSILPSPPPSSNFEAQRQAAQNTIDQALAASMPQGEDFSGVGQNFIDNALKPNPADQFIADSMLGQLLGADSAEDKAKRRVSDMLNSGAVFNQENRRFELPTGSGMLSMGENGNVIYQGPSDDTYRGPFADKVNFDSDPNAADPSYYQMQEASRNQQAQLDPGTTTPEQIDDLAINYLQNPYYLYGGSGNLFQPYGYAGGTLVDLLQTRNMTMPDQAAPNLNLFGNPRDFT